MAKNAKGKSGAQKVALPENAGLGEITPAKNGGNDMLTQDEFVSPTDATAIYGILL